MKHSNTLVKQINPSKPSVLVRSYSPYGDGALLERDVEIGVVLVLDFLRARNAPQKLVPGLRIKSAEGFRYFTLRAGGGCSLLEKLSGGWGVGDQGIGGRGPSLDFWLEPRRRTRAKDFQFV